MSRTPSLADRWNRYWFLQSVELWLDPVPGRRRRAILRELRANLTEAARDVGMSAAIADLGRPRALARQFVDGEPEVRPHWNQGAVAAALAVGAWLYATMFYTIGMLDALDSTGASGPAQGRFLGTEVRVLNSDVEISGAFSGFPWVPLVLAVVLFLLVGRAWRALPRRSPVEVSAP